MKCFKCGAEAPAGTRFCPHCGASMSGGMEQNQNMQGYQSIGYQNPIYQNPGYTVPGNAGDPLATPSMVLGIVADAIFVLACLVAQSAEVKILGYGTGYMDDSSAAMIVLLAIIGEICALIGFIMAICPNEEDCEKGKGDCRACLQRYPRSSHTGGHPGDDFSLISGFGSTVALAIVPWFSVAIGHPA